MAAARRRQPSLIHRKTFYLADYEPIDLLAWCDAFQRAFQSRPIPHCRSALAHMLAYCGDAVNAIGFGSFPFNSFRLNNVLTQYQFDLAHRSRLRTVAVHHGARRHRDRGMASQNPGA